MLKIIGFSIGAAVLYGILHDLVTAHVCVEYFTVAHPFVFPSEDPVDMALIWGVRATWWVGLILGTGVAIAAKIGSRPPLELRQLAPKIGRLLLNMAIFALFLGLAGYLAANRGWIWLDHPLSTRIPPEHHQAFFFDAFAHTGSYLYGMVGGAALIHRTWKLRSFQKDLSDTR